jgi:fructose-1,6-bisphosphatase/inositol monophosphatase family enzyme
MMMVAEGSADAYLFENADEGRNLRATDIAASYRILAEAGGGLTASNGTPVGDLPLGLERRTSVLAWGDAALGRAIGRGELV